MLEWLFAPSCPCDPAAKEWVEDRLQWLSEEFDDHAFNGREIVLPTPEFFPDDYDASPGSVQVLLERVCGYMDVVPDLVELELVSNVGKIGFVNEGGQALPGAGGMFEEGENKFLIRIDRAELDHPMGLVGTIAHELAHARLLGEGRVSHDEFDHELITDLTVVFFGLGIFLANTVRYWESSNSS